MATKLVAMGQSFFPGEIGIRVIIDGKMSTFATPKERLVDVEVGSRIPIKEPERLTSYFWVEVRAMTEDERGAVYTVEKVKPKDPV